MTKILRRLGRALRHPVSKNAVALYGLQVATFLVPLVTLPYISRVLGPGAFGLVIFAQGFAFMLVLVVQWGLMIYGIREAAAKRDDPEALADLVAWVRGGQLVLSLVSAVIALGVLFAVPKMSDHPGFLVLAWVAGVAIALSPSWYFFGLERLTVPSLIQLALRAVAAGLTFVLVQDPGDAWIVLALFAAPSVAAWLVTDALMYREVPFRLPRLASALDSLRRTASLALGTAAVTMYTTFNVVLLGLFVPAAQIAHFGAAERIVRASLQSMGPVAAAVYPRLSYLQAEGERERATRLLFIAAAVLGGGGVIIAVGLMVFAPFLIELIFGSAFVAEGVPILRILVLLIPLNILGVVAGGWLLSLRLEHVVVRFVLVAGVLNVILGVILTPLFGPEGMAVSVVIAELAAATGAVITLYRSERNEQVRVLPRLRVRRSAAPEPGRSPVG